MAWKLFLDDLRDPVDRECVIARSYDEAVALILERGMPMDISFDNDLGPSPAKEGRDLAKWLVEADLDGVIAIPAGFTFHVHSANPVAREAIENLLTAYLAHKGSGQPS